MDLAAARTFLSIVEAGNFIAASRQLNVTQSTVSARIKSLEDTIGKTLFVRTKSECRLTPAGAQFYRYARTIVRAWEEARHQVAVPEGFSNSLSLGGQYSLWNHFLLEWLSVFRAAEPACSIRASVGMPQRLIRELVDGSLDLGVMYNPENRPGLVVEKIFDDKLILVSAKAETAPALDDYVFVDWGDEFRTWHSANHEALHNPGLSLELGSIGIEYVIENCKAGYFPERIAAPYLRAGALHRAAATAFTYPAYAVYQSEYAAPQIMNSALKELRKLAKN